MLAITIVINSSTRLKPEPYQRGTRSTWKDLFMRICLVFSPLKLAFLDPGQSATRGRALQVDRNDEAAAADVLRKQETRAVDLHHRRSAGAALGQANHCLTIEGGVGVVGGIAKDRIRRGSAGRGIEGQRPTSRHGRGTWRQRSAGRYGRIHQQRVIGQGGAVGDLFVK